MGRSLADLPEARAVFSEADAALDFPLTRLMWEGPEERLTLTEYAQPALLTVGVALWRSLPGLPVAMAAGHSLGEYTALVAAGALAFADAVRLVQTRGRLMQTAVAVGEGGMLAVVGLEADRVRATLAAVGPDVAIAGYNTPEQTVVSGSRARLAQAADALLAQGARIIPLQVSAPFHSPLMQPVEQGLAAALASVQVTAPRFAVVSNVDAEGNSDPARVADLLLRQVVSPVRWVESVRWMVARGVTHMLELGPGQALRGMARRIDRALVCESVGDADGVARLRTQYAA